MTELRQEDNYILYKRGNDFVITIWVGKKCETVGEFEYFGDALKKLRQWSGRKCNTPIPTKYLAEIKPYHRKVA